MPHHASPVTGGDWIVLVAFLAGLVFCSLLIVLSSRQLVERPGQAPDVQAARRRRGKQAGRKAAPTVVVRRLIADRRFLRRDFQ